MNTAETTEMTALGTGLRTGSAIILVIFLAGCVSTEPYNIYSASDGSLVVTRVELDGEVMKQQGVDRVGWNELASAKRYVYIDKIPQGGLLADLTSEMDFGRSRPIEACEISTTAVTVEPYGND